LSSFIAMAGWMMIPDKIDDTGHVESRFGVFGTTVLAFFIAEMGDKTQIATVALAARYMNLVAVVAGTTLGMMLANVPAVLLGGPRYLARQNPRASQRDGASRACRNPTRPSPDASCDSADSAPAAQSSQLRLRDWYRSQSW
jgi:hypothetical protein